LFRSGIDSRFGTTANRANCQEQALAWRPGISAFRPSGASYAGSAGTLELLARRGKYPRAMPEAYDRCAALRRSVRNGCSYTGGEARRLAVGKWLPPFGGVVCWEAEMGDTKKGGRYVEPLVPVQEGRERQLAWLERGNSAGRRLPVWGVLYWKSVNRGIGIERSRRYANPESYLVPPAHWPAMRPEVCILTQTPEDGAVRLKERHAELEMLLRRFDDELPHY
jgi:hypothetical protein